MFILSNSLLIIDLRKRFHITDSLDIIELDGSQLYLCLDLMRLFKKLARVLTLNFVESSILEETNYILAKSFSLVRYLL